MKNPNCYDSTNISDSERQELIDGILNVFDKYLGRNITKIYKEEIMVDSNENLFNTYSKSYEIYKTISGTKLLNKIFNELKKEEII